VDVRVSVNGVPEAVATRGSSRVAGLTAALLVGVFGGSILAPNSFAGDDFTGKKALAFLPSFGIGSLCVATVWTSVWYAMQRSHGTAPPLQLRATLLAGIASGMTWNAGNLCSIIAINFYQVPFGVAYPILQASLIFGGLLGIFVFRELTDRRAIIAFFASALLVLGGAVILGLYGPQEAADAADDLYASPPPPPALP